MSRNVEKAEDRAGRATTSTRNSMWSAAVERRWNKDESQRHVLFMVKSSGRPQHEVCSGREGVALSTSTNIGLWLGTESAETKPQTCSNRVEFISQT